MAKVVNFYTLFTVFLPLVVCWPSIRLVRTDSKDFYNVENVVPNRTVCGELEMYKWYSDYHECFISRKYNDGGQDLNSIVDRILQHSEDCVEKSKKECNLDYKGFAVILTKVIEQMKDYSVMYLENIMKGRGDIKDLNCVESTLSMKTYERCFKNKLANINLSDDELQNVVHDGLFCANRGNWGCSREAKTYLNRIVRTLLGIQHPSEEYVEEDVTTTTPAPPVMQWYDYIFQPFISAWNFIKSIFG